MNKISKVCVKCGWDDSSMTLIKVGTKFYKDDDKELFKWFGYNNTESSYDKHFAISSECIKLHCKTCHHEWVTKPLDAEVDNGN